jgi:hypothetical protein
VLSYTLSIQTDGTGHCCLHRPFAWLALWGPSVPFLAQREQLPLAQTVWAIAKGGHGGPCAEGWVALGLISKEGMAASGLPQLPKGQLLPWMASTASLQWPAAFANKSHLTISFSMSLNGDWLGFPELKDQKLYNSSRDSDCLEANMFIKYCCRLRLCNCLCGQIASLAFFRRSLWTQVAIDFVE